MTARQAHVQIKRIYEPAPGDGTRVLVDRIWPRGMSKERAHLDEWCKQIAPSTELRKWYGHDPARFNEFIRRYREELPDPNRAAALAHLRELAREKSMLTLLTATKDYEISEAAVLANLIKARTPSHPLGATAPAPNRRTTPGRETSGPPAE